MKQSDDNSVPWSQVCDILYFSRALAQLPPFNTCDTFGVFGEYLAFFHDIKINDETVLAIAAKVPLVPDLPVLLDPDLPESLWYQLYGYCTVNKLKVEEL